MNTYTDEPTIIEWVEGARIEPPAIYRGLPNELYHHGPGISKSGISKVRVSPAHYKTARDNPRPSTPAMVLGTALHALVLEPDRFAEEFVPDPAPGSYSKDAKAARAALEEAGKTVVANKNDEDKGIWGRGDWDTIHYMRDAVAAHPIAGILLDPDQIHAELSVYWRDRETKELCKCRPDAINTAHRVAVDLKSAIEAGYSPFARACVKYEYHLQDPFYRDGLRAAGYPVDAFVFVAVEKDPPYAVGIYQITQADRELGRTIYRAGLRTFHDCAEADEWPAYDTAVRELELPGYARFSDLQ